MYPKKRLPGSSGQSLIFEFLLFFLIGLGLFIGIGNYFKIQSDMLRGDVAPYSVELANNYLSAVIVSSIDTCKQCDSMETQLKLSDTVFGYYLNVSLAKGALSIRTSPPGFQSNSTVNNLNYSLSFSEGWVPSTQAINLTYNRNQNKIEIR
jgi:hypothetical protein